MQVDLIYYSDINTKKYEEHLVYTFYISGISRALLQELARHRMASYSVKSTRYTISELRKDDVNLMEQYDKDHSVDSLYTSTFWDTCSKYIVSTGNELVDWSSCTSLMRLQAILLEGISNDIAKYALPEAFKTELQWSINARSLQNFLSLRSDKSALWEIRQLAHNVFDALPDDHKYLFVDHIKDEV